MFPVLSKFAEDNMLEVHLARQQNHYPDITFIDREGSKYAVDVKSTFRKGQSKKGDEMISGMTLGTFMGYFRNRESKSIITYPYSEYKKHFVLGVVYTQVKGVDERRAFHVDELIGACQPLLPFSQRVTSLVELPSVARDFEFFLQEKYKIAADYPGSGNTKNIGSTRFLQRIVNGVGIFESLGVEVFDNYWMSYRTKQMASADGFARQPYKNLAQYAEHIRDASNAIGVAPENLVSEEAELAEIGEPIDSGDDEA